MADAIGDVIRGEDVTVDIRPAGPVEDIGNYSAVVVGSSIRAGRWLPDAVDFLADFQEALARLPVAFFTTCLTMVDDTDANRGTGAGLHRARAWRGVPAVKPVGIGLFAGSLDPTRRRLILPPGAGPHGDYRNWEAIRAWATAIRPALLAGDVHRLPDVTDLSNTVLAYTDLSQSDLSQVDCMCRSATVPT